MNYNAIVLVSREEVDASVVAKFVTTVLMVKRMKDRI